MTPFAQTQTDAHAVLAAHKKLGLRRAFYALRAPGFPPYHTFCQTSVGAGFYPARGRGRAPPLRTTGNPPPSLQNPMSLRSRCAHRLRQSVTLVPMAPLPKGGWHGKAVTGGYIFPAAPAGHAGPALQSAALSGRADRAVRPYKPFRRGRCLHRPARRISCNLSLRSRCAHWLRQSVSF